MTVENTAGVLPPGSDSQCHRRTSPRRTPAQRKVSSTRVETSKVAHLLARIKGNLSPKALLLIYTVYMKALPGASEGILVWYGQTSEVQFTRGGGVAEPKNLEI